MRYLFLALIALTQIACTSARTATPSGEPLSLYVTVEPYSGPSWGTPIIEIRAVNEGINPVGFTKTFGFKEIYLYLEINRLDSSQEVEYPVEATAELFSAPEYRCIDPGENVSLSVDLGHWTYIVGGDDTDNEEDAPYFGYWLGPGKYQVRAVYDAPGTTQRLSCPTANHQVVSEWVNFEIPD